MEIKFLSTVAVIAPYPAASRKLYVDALGLPLQGSGGTRINTASRSTAARASVYRRLRRQPTPASVLLSGRESDRSLKPASNSTSPT